MSPGVRTALAAVAVVAVAGTFVFSVKRVVERQRTAAEITRLRDELYRARTTADRCQGALRTSESAIRSLTSSIDSLRSLVGEYESAAGGGVRAEEYDDYLVVFEEYNDSVGVWEGRERRLRAAEASCRETIQTHNALSDSLQAVLEEAGIETG